MKPELIEIPERIETDRLIIRAMRPGDGSDLNIGVRAAWESLKEWMPWAQGEMPSIEDSEILCRQGYARWISRSDLWVGIWEKKSGDFIGGSGLHRINWKIPHFEIGYWCRTDKEGLGFISETANALTKLAFEKLNCRRLEIRCDSRNERSLKVMERLGFEKEAKLVNSDVSVKGDLRDTLIYVRFNQDNLPELKLQYFDK